MSDVFAPKISYRIAGLHMATPRTPWQYLEDWEMSDRDPKTTLKDVADKMKERWPGNYRVVVKEVQPPDRFSKWALEFDDPAEETLFNLKWS